MNMNTSWYDAISELCSGLATPAETARAVWGLDEHDSDSEVLVTRLTSYRNSLVGGEASGLAHQHPETHRLVCELLGPEHWVELSVAFLRAHPRTHTHRLVSLAPFCDWLRTREELPPWLADLAKLERVVLEADVAPDDPPGLLAPGCSVTTVAHDVLAWNEDGASIHTPPAAIETLVLTWRDAELVTRQAELGPFEQFVIAQLEQGERGATPAQLAEFGLDEHDFDEVVEQLVELGVVERVA